MKHIIALPLLATMLFLASCGHQVSTVGLGTGFNIGGGQYGSIRYGDGFFGNFVTKDGITFRAELDSTTGVSYDPATNSYKGIKSIEYAIAPQITGYTVDMAKESPDAMAFYYDAVKSYYSTNAQKPSASSISDEKSTTATSGVSAMLKEAIARASARMSGKDEKGEFCPSGNCKAEGLRTDDGITSQSELAGNLAYYAERGYPEDADVSYKDELVHYMDRLAKLKAAGKTTTRIRIDSYEIKDRKLVSLKLVAPDGNGGWQDIECVECYDIEFDN